MPRLAAATPALLVLLAACASAGGPEPPGERDAVVSTRLVSAATGASTDVATWQRGSVHEAVVRRPPEEVWPALGEVFREMGLEVNAVDTGAGVLGLQNQRVRRLADRKPSWSLRCGIGPTGELADQRQLTVTLLTQLQPTPGGGTLVRTQLEGYTLDGLHSSHPGRCVSRGRLEREIVRELEKRAGGG